MDNYSKNFELKEIENKAFWEGKLDKNIIDKIKQLDVEIKDLEDKIEKIKNTGSVSISTEMDRVKRLEYLEKIRDLKMLERYQLININ
jgi:hypothetical protein